MFLLEEFYSLGHLGLQSILSLFFVYAVKKCSNLIIFYVAVQFSKHQFLREFFHYVFLFLFVTVNWL